jgi:serine/threonine-protein kinase
MGMVYLASREADGAHVAVKIIRPACAPSDQEVQRFLREAQILCALRHPNIVSFHQLGRLGQLFYIVMDFVPGSDARQMVQRHGPLTIDRAVRIVCQALEALHYAHQKRYVHRDVKPANLLLSGHEPAEVCRLADFGLARVYCESRMSGLTLLGKMGGTLSFMAPEQILDFRNVGPAADQYGAAATLYHLCTGQLVYPVDPDRDERQFINILLSEPVPIEQRRPDVPAGLARIIHTALAKNPRDRFPDVAAFREALSAYQGAPSAR